MPIHGRNIQIFNGNNLMIAGARSCSIQKRGEVIETASADSGTARTFVPGRTEWKVELSHLIISAKGGIPLVNNTYTLRVVAENNAIFSGQAICTEATITATMPNLAQGSIRFQGTGELNEL